MRNHTVVVGYGTKGRSAVRALLDDGAEPAQIVVVDNDLDHIADASDDGIAARSTATARAPTSCAVPTSSTPSGSSWRCRATTPPSSSR